eukprot:6465743-Amphidinium_carterae.1
MEKLRFSSGICPIIGGQKFFAAPSTTLNSTAVVVEQAPTYSGGPPRPDLGILRLTQQTMASAGGSSRPDLGIGGQNKKTNICVLN